MPNVLDFESIVNCQIEQAPVSFHLKGIRRVKTKNPHNFCGERKLRAALMCAKPITCAVQEPLVRLQCPTDGKDDFFLQSSKIIYAQVLNIHQVQRKQVGEFSSLFASHGHRAQEGFAFCCIVEQRHAGLERGHVEARCWKAQVLHFIPHSTSAFTQSPHKLCPAFVFHQLEPTQQLWISGHVIQYNIGQ